MEVQAVPNEGAGERMPHQASSALDAPGTSGRAGPAQRLSSEHLREGATLRSSRNGTELLPAADDLIAQDDAAGQKSLRPRPAALAVSGPGVVSGRAKSRRTSIAEFLGFGSQSTPKGQPGELSPAPSRDPTAQGIGSAGQPSLGRARRGSFLQSFGHSFGLGAQGTPSEAPESGAPSVAEGATPEGEDRGRPSTVGGMSTGRRRRASMLDMFRPSHLLDTSQSVGVPGLTTTDSIEPSAGSGLLRSKSSAGRKSRRASVMDFFRNSATGLRSSATGLTDTDGGGSTKSGNRSFKEHGGTSRGRRRSVIDILGHTSKRVFAKLVNQEFLDDDKSEEEVDEGPLWFTSLSDFKPLTFKYLTGRYSSAYFACAIKTGEHYILKQFEKEKMSLADERGVRRALAFAQMLEHQHLVRCCGTWEDEKALYIVEEYATKGDLLQDSMSHPEKYTEAFMATKVVKPLLEVLVYLHNINVVHRAIFPEYVMFGREDVLKLGHFTSAVDQRLDPPNERIHFLDYMAPEMLAVQDEPRGAVPGPHTGIRHDGVHTHQNKQVRMLGFSNDGNSRGGTQTQLSIPLSSGNNTGSGAAGPSANGAQVSPHAADGSARNSPLTSNGGTRRSLFSNGGVDALWLASPGANDTSLPPGPERSGASRSGHVSPLLGRLRSRQSSSALLTAQGPDPLRAAGALSRETSNYGGLPAGGGMSPLRGRSRMDLGNSDAPWLTPNPENSSRSFSGSPIRRRKSTMDEMSAPWLRPVANSGAGGEEEPTEPPLGAGDGVQPAASPADADAASALPAAASPEVAKARSDDPRAPSKLPGSPGSSGETFDREVKADQSQADGRKGAPIGDRDHAVASLAGYIPAAERGATAVASLAGYLPSQPLLPNGNGCGGSRPGSATKPANGPAANGSRPGSASMPASAAAAANGRPSSAAKRSSGGGGMALAGGDAKTSGPGPVAEALMQEPSSPARSTTGDESTTIKRGRTGVLFESGVSGGEELLSPPMSPLAEPPSGNRSRVQSARSRAASRGASRVASREASATAGAGNMMAGLRTMARNITLRIGQVLVGKGAEGGGFTGTAEEEGGGGTTARRGGADPSPRQSQAGGGVGGGPGDASIFVPSNPWEWQEHYNEKVDCWQVGCLVHEILCNSLPFEAEDKLLACALILWADIVSFPDTLSPECHAFMRACLTKNPAARPSAADLLQHPWIARHAGGEVLKSVRQLREDQNLHHGVGVDGQQLTLLQRIAVAVGLGSMVSAAHHAGEQAPEAGGIMGWLKRWTAKVLPLGGSNEDASKEGEHKFENALHLVQEQHQHDTEAVLGHEVTRPKSSDVEAGAAAAAARRHSLEAQVGAGGTGGADTRWGVVL
ncbi:hypothetical protein HYH02_006092 [Chlamydomonas schloesseri]|uniref:Protein kinase domain-containing protein n=1 Tax=Chlamydomonas schloesseri TaxID=2026947 RepID=A0A835WJD4_9CHLO|nr:hypothetical protein HYH02_006092 [Chlamydomonas schloesseri]|eukprot:KAG2448738.1 hypothetical protein HYH02_006092 [Chlamydomonas schloesseri]